MYSLIKNGAEIHADNDYAFGYSAANGYYDIIKLLLENGANNPINKIVLVNKNDEAMVCLLNEYGIKYQYIHKID